MGKVEDNKKNSFDSFFFLQSLYHALTHSFTPFPQSLIHQSPFKLSVLIETKGLIYSLNASFTSQPLWLLILRPPPSPTHSHPFPWPWWGHDLCLRDKRKCVFWGRRSWVELGRSWIEIKSTLLTPLGPIWLRFTSSAQWWEKWGMGGDDGLGASKLHLECLLDCQIKAVLRSFQRLVVSDRLFKVRLDNFFGLTLSLWCNLIKQCNSG